MKLWILSPQKYTQLHIRRERICLHCRRRRFSPCVGKIAWRRRQLPTPVFWPGESHEQRSLAGYSPWGPKEKDMTKQLSLTLSVVSGFCKIYSQRSLRIWVLPLETISDNCWLLYSVYCILLFFFLIDLNRKCKTKSWHHHMSMVLKASALTAVALRLLYYYDFCLGPRPGLQLHSLGLGLSNFSPGLLCMSSSLIILILILPHSMFHFGF